MRRVFAAALGLAACGRAGDLAIETPADRAFVRGGVPLVVSARADVERLAVEVDGRIFAEMQPDLAREHGWFIGTVPSLPPGEHVVTIYVPDAPGVTASSRIFVDRLPLAPVDGWGFSDDASWIVTLSKRRNADDGLAAGILEATSVDDASIPTARLSGDGSFAEVAGSRIAWVEAWDGGGGGRLRLARITDAGGSGLPPRVEIDEEHGWDAVREIRFSSNGAMLGARDDGLLLFRDSFEEPERIASASDAFTFVGPLDDLASFAAVDDTAYRATFVEAATGRVTALAEPVRAIVRNPARREVALFEAELPRALLVWDFAVPALARGPTRTRGAEFSRDGSWLAALTDGGALFLSARSLPAPFEPLAGTFAGAAFDAGSEHLFALTTGGMLVDAALGDPISAVAVASGVIDFAPLADGAVAWYDETFTLHVRTTSGAIVPLGALHATRPEVVLGSNGLRLAFTIASGEVRVADVVTGATADWGVDASRPTFLGDAFAWLELRADAEAGGLANHDLWLFPEFPASLFGPVRVAERVKSDQSLPKSFAEDRLAVLAGLPRRGERWEAHAVCVRADGEVRRLGDADAKMRFVFFLPDGRIARFGPDGRDEQVMFVSRCE